MSKVHPDQNQCQDLKSTHLHENAENHSSCNRCRDRPRCHPSLCALTVWKRSSMSFQGTDGFTVFDGSGRLAFRVDNYSRKDRGLVLMDGSGEVLLTLKPQRWSMQYQWHGYRGESQKSQEFTMMRRRSREHEAVVFMGTRAEGEADFKVEGSFGRRNCKIKTANDRLAAVIARKRVNPTVLLSDDVFSLVVQPDFDPQLIMAFVIVLDRICPKPFTPLLCS
ncbi:hypothetical protein NMG60_11035865 [Bertholletia excelsa]